MAKTDKGCIKAAFTALKNFTQDELDLYVHQVFARARTYDDLMNKAAFEKAINEINNERMKEFFNDANKKAKNVFKFERDAKKIRDKLANMRSLLTKRYANVGDNIASAQKAAEGELSQHLYRNLTHDEMEFFNSGLNDEIITDALDGKEIESAPAKKIAKLINEYTDYRNTKLVTSGAMEFSQIREDRKLRAIHDSSKLINGARSLLSSAKDRVAKKYNTADNKLMWINFIKKYIDIDATFKFTDAMNVETKELEMGRVDEILKDIYDNITTGKSNIYARSTIVNDKETVQQRRHMFFVWKDWRSQLEYNRVYGRGNLFGMLRSDLQSSGNRIGMADRWGDNPRLMYSELRKVDKEVNQKNPFWWRNTDNYFKSVMGEDRTPVDPNKANFMANFRTLTSMARLPKILIQSFSDIGYIASFAQRMGLNYFQSYFSVIRNIFNNYPSEERKYIANLYKIMVDSHLGYQGRWTDANNMSELLNKVSTRYFKAIGLSGFDRGNKISIMHLMSKQLYNNSGKSFDELNKSLQKWVSKFMDESEWDLLRRKNGNNLFTTDNVNALTDEELKAHQEKNGLDTPLYQLRTDLFRKVYAMFDVASENAVLSPGEFERAWCFQGEAPGTLKGEFLRTISQFKMYTMSYIDRVLINGWRDADTMGQKLMWATSMMMGTLPLSLLSVYLDNLSNGLSMPDWDMLTIPEREKYLVNLISPSLAIFSGLLDERSQNSDMAISLLGSPSARFIGNTLATAFSLAGGNPKKAAKHLSNTANYIFPIQTIPIVSPFIRQAMGNEAHLEPGQTNLYGQ